jgi:hypothetical protein
MEMSMMSKFCARVALIILLIGRVAAPVATAATPEASTSPRPPCGVTLSIVDQPLSPIIKKGDPGTEGITYGLEGGAIVKLARTYHLIISELVGDPRAVKMKIGYWTSEDRFHWQRRRTLYESSGDFTGRDPRASLWAMPPAYDQQQQRWNFFYVAYRAKPNEGTAWTINHEGQVWRAVSEVPGPEGIGGPYKDAGVILQPDADSQPWEGLQGTDSFHICQAADRWFAFYGSAQTQPAEQHNPAYARWNVGLCGAPAIGGPWKRLPEGNPILSNAENPVVTRLRGGRYVAVFDIVNSDPMAIGYLDSPDAVHWSQPKPLTLRSEKGFWLRNARTPQGLIEEDDGTCTLFYSGFVVGGKTPAEEGLRPQNPNPMEESGRSFRSMGLVVVKLDENR